MIFLVAPPLLLCAPPVFIPFLTEQKEAVEITDFYIKRPNGFTKQDTLIFAGIIWATGN
jgi:hypothetical protein